MKNVVFIGMPGSGKTVIARMVAAKLERKYVDLDKVIAVRNYANIDNLKVKLGETEFRVREAEIVQEASRHKDLVMSTGDGMVLIASNVKALKASGICILLRAPIDVLLRRLGENPLFLPMVSNKPNIRQEFDKMWRERQPLYQGMADETIDTERLTLDQVVERVVEILKRRSEL